MPYTSTPATSATLPPALTCHHPSPQDTHAHNLSAVPWARAGIQRDGIAGVGLGGAAALAVKVVGRTAINLAGKL